MRISEQLALATEAKQLGLFDEPKHRGAEGYAERQKARQIYYASKAEKAQRDAEAHRKASSSITGRIPMGQPILRGHHSQKRHERDIARSHAQMRKSMEALKKSQAYASRAAGVGAAGISTDDPDAVKKLKAKVAVLEAQRDGMKKANAEYRRLIKKGGTPEETVMALNVSDELKAAALNNFRFAPGGAKQPFPSFTLTNLGAKIKTAQNRIQELGRIAKVPEMKEREGKGWKFAENQDTNRVTFEFDGKPSAEVRRMLKQYGYKWSSFNGVWQRMANAAGRNTVDLVIKELERLMR